MAKNDNSRSISGWQRSAGKRAALASKNSKILHGGVCCSCGQRSNSCSVGKSHSGCPGFFSGAFENEWLTRRQRLGMLLATGVPTDVSNPGIWMSESDFQQKQEKQADLAKNYLSSQVFLISIWKDEGRAQFSHVEVKNGLGQPVSWDGHNWVVCGEAISSA